MQETKETEETETKATEKPAKGFCHTVRHKDGGKVTIKNYTISKAIKNCCSDCCGFETDPRECNEKTCELYPYRGYSKSNRTRAIYKNHSTPEQIEKLKEYAKKRKEQLATTKN